MFEPRVIFLSHTEAPYAEYDDGTPERWSADVCSADGRHLSVEWTRDGVTSLAARGPCECTDDWCPDLDQPRWFRFTLYGDGDSGERAACFGGYHHRFQCMEFGMGWYPEGAPEACDGSCRAPVDSLPAPVAKAVQDFLDATERDG